MSKSGALETGAAQLRDAEQEPPRGGGAQPKASSPSAKREGGSGAAAQGDQYLLEKFALMRWRRYSAPVMGGYFFCGPSITASSLAWQKKARL